MHVHTHTCTMIRWLGILLYCSMYIFTADWVILLSWLYPSSSFIKGWSAQYISLNMKYSCNKSINTPPFWTIMHMHSCINDTTGQWTLPWKQLFHGQNYTRTTAWSLIKLHLTHSYTSSTITVPNIQLHRYNSTWDMAAS